MSREAAIALIATVVIAGLVVAYGDRRPVGGPPGEVRTNTYAEPLGNVRRLDVEIRMGAGTLRVRTVDTANAYEAEITRSQGLPAVVSYANGRLRLNDRGYRFSATRYTNEWNVGLNRRVPIDLEVATGAGRASLDLTGVNGSAEVRAGAGEVRVEFAAPLGRLTQLELEGGVGRFEAMGLGNAGAARVEARSGVGEFVLDFTGAPRGHTILEVRGGVGRIELIIPEGLGVRIRVTRGLTRRLQLVGFTQVGGDTYTNAAWANAPARLDVHASLGVGELQVRGR